MLLTLIEKYRSLEDDAKNIMQTLTLCQGPLDIKDIIAIVSESYSIAPKRIQAVLRDAEDLGLVKRTNSYSHYYVIDIHMRVWIYPLIVNKKTIEKKASTSTYSSHEKCEYMLRYLSALVHKRDMLLDCEKNFLLYEPLNIEKLTCLFYQPAYERFYPDISGNLIAKLYACFAKPILKNLGELDKLRQLDEQLKKNKSIELQCIQAEIAFKSGAFKYALELTHQYDVSVSYFAEATMSFFDDKRTAALASFDKGMKKQRKEYKLTYLPLIPEITLLYTTVWLMEAQEVYTPVFKKVAGNDSKYYDEITQMLVLVCDYFVRDIDYSKRILSYLQEFEEISDSLGLWKIVALGLVGEALEQDSCPKAERLILKAYQNGYFTLAYEASYAFLKWADSLAINKIQNALSARLKYQPILSRIKQVELWEKQLNTYMSLEAVQSLIRKEEGNGKSRIAYRFFPERNNAYPILQTCNTGGVWTNGRNISMNNFILGKVDCMNEQDKRIAIAEKSFFGYSLGRNAIGEMTGHPHVYLQDSNIPVELIAAQPIINIVKLKDGKYKLESDVSDMRNNVLIVKETNTRYKVYHLTESQREIIGAIQKGIKIPEQGMERLHLVLKHFSRYIGIQSDLSMDEDDQARELQPDSRIRVQILPLGDGLKAELFVKPFGDHPPYCKPGRGGKSLLAHENGERLRVSRDMEAENKNNEILLNEIQSIESLNTTNDLISFDNPFDSLDLLDILGRYQEIAVVEWPEGERFKIRSAVNFNNLNLRVKGGIDWFELEGELQIDEQTVLSISALLDLLKQSHGRFVALNNGEFLALNEQLKRRLSELDAFSMHTKNAVKINRFASASLVNVLNDFENLKVDKAWRDFRKRLTAVQQLDIPVPAMLQTELRPYQLAGYQWMIRLAGWGAGACLADDMGLGKTVQAIAVLLQRASIGPALVVSPVSVQPNWVSEVGKFAPSLTIKTLNENNRSETMASLEAGDLLITSYGLLLSEEASLTVVKWATVVLDEAHVIKNYTTKTSKAAMLLQAEFRIILTGTPLQNHLGEIWNLFQFINPGLLGSLTYFVETYIKQGEHSRNHLKKLITPFILRRTKTAVLDELPPKTEIIKKIELSNEERAFYEVLRRNAIETLANDDSPQGAKHLKTLAEITRLRQACCNPALVEPAVGIESTKLSAFLEIATELKENGHRALVFSQFVSHLNIVRYALDKAGFTYRYLDGSTPVAQREKEVRNFQNGQGDLFLISLKAGGLGLNLTAADFVIHLDPWWNPAIEDQASDRAHRIGQTRPVTVYRLVTDNTIEEKIIQLHNTKRDLADSLLEGSDQSAKLSMAELMSLIKG
ncbi:MAG: DEAD/DEAH box helicase [Candidatus Symbiothrix sp.]|jgi:SNF2 family DNA or RNA helicase|nr:DEAD/DEAH box helicase [Candidatus Symbiothrix sp.]